MITPIAPMTPLLGGLAGYHDASDCQSIMDLPNKALVSQGRSAIALALQLSAIGEGDDVLMPAYHCPAMTAAVRAVGARPRFFRIQDTLAIRAEDVIAAGTKDTKAVLLPHFFAWAQSSALFDELRDGTKWLLIEDCAHAFFGRPGRVPPGSLGDYSIASIPKFFPSLWGGVLASAQRVITLPLQPSSLPYQLKLALNSVEQSASFGVFGRWSRPLEGVLSGFSRMRSAAIRRGRTPAAGITEGPPDDEPGFAVVDMNRFRESAGWWPEACVSNRANSSSRAERRYTAFRKMVRAVGANQYGFLLNDRQAPDFPPYVMPLRLRRPERDFTILRAAGVPMYRWEHAATGYCPVTDDYRLSVVQLPCHDSLADEQIESIGTAVRRILN